MQGMEITCLSCERGWVLKTSVSLYLQLDLASQPCPYCEAYTLTAADVRISDDDTKPVGTVLRTPAYVRARGLTYGS